MFCRQLVVGARWLIPGGLTLVTACGDCGSTQSMSPKPARDASGPHTPEASPRAVQESKGLSTPDAAPPSTTRDCEQICGDYFMYDARRYRLCGGRKHQVEVRLGEPQCLGAQNSWRQAPHQVDAKSLGLSDDAGALCQCGSELPQKAAGKRQVSGPDCDGVCERAETLHDAMGKTCSGLPGTPQYGDPRCLAEQKRFYGMRPQIFECWCLHVSDRQ